MAAYAIVRDSEAEARRELARITEVRGVPPGFANFDQWLSGTQLERELKVQEYSVSNRGLRPNLIGTPEQIQERVAEYEAAGPAPAAAADEPPGRGDGAFRRPGDRPMQRSVSEVR
jgi:FMNH2-dependent dimethyl sulfone monooxygenase